MRPVNKMAQHLVIPVQTVAVLKVLPGRWTKSMLNNSGYGTVKVTAQNSEDEEAVRDYEVFGKQIDDSADCRITGVVEF